jgi:hypothetical protein
VTECIKKELGSFLLSLFVSGPRSLRSLGCQLLVQHDPATSVGDVVLWSVLVMPVLIYAIISATTRVSEYSSLNT